MDKLDNKIEKSFPLVKIEGIESQKTLYFEIGKRQIIPGQFFMLNYQVCQKPLSVSYYNGCQVGFTVLKRGPGTQKMLEAKPGQYFGITGPLGSYFETAPFQRFLLIGGGCGAAPVYFLADYLNHLNKSCDILLGAKTMAYLNYTLPLKKAENCRIQYYTEDQSGDKQGLVTAGIEQLLEKNNYDTACICGPEIMMKICCDVINSRIKPIQLSIERYMKCGIGVCGSCVLDQTGTRVCSEGPVFHYSQLAKSNEFGVYHRNSGGVIEQI